jgi:hypothetical protein
MGRGKHQSSLELIQASYDILEEIEPATVRAVCYRLFTAGIIPDMSERSTGKVSRQLTWARENDELPWEWIVDETRTPERVSSWADPKSYIRAVKRSYRKDLWRDQDNKVEVWSEKGTVRGTLGPILEEYGVTFRVQHGFASATSLHDAAEDSMDESFTVLYVGDHDPSGMYMSEMDIPDRLERYEADIAIERVALLTSDTVSLPHFDLSSKRGDRRHDWYREWYGDRCWELDAMNPVDLRARVENEIRNRIDWEAWELAQKAEKAEIASIDDILGKWQQAISTPDQE